MPAKAFVDGPECNNPSGVAEAWMETKLVKERLRLLRKLVLDRDDPDSKTIAPSRENMVYNAEVLEVLARDMHSRGRCGADPIESICEITMAFYKKQPVYKEIDKGFNIKVTAYNTAWVLHKMVSRIRNSLSKHATSRVSWFIM